MILINNSSSIFEADSVHHLHSGRLHLLLVPQRAHHPRLRVHSAHLAATPDRPRAGACDPHHGRGGRHQDPPAQGLLDLGFRHVSGYQLPHHHDGVLRVQEQAWVRWTGGRVAFLAAPRSCVHQHVLLDLPGQHRWVCTAGGRRPGHFCARVVPAQENLGGNQGPDGNGHLRVRAKQRGLLDLPCQFHGGGGADFA